MQWDASAGAGFTTTDPWLPLAADAARRNVERQAADRSSLLCLYRDLIALRRRAPALHRGSFRLLDAPDGVLAYERRAGESLARIALNFTSSAQRVGLGAEPFTEGLRSAYGAPLPATPEAIDLAPCEGIVLVDASAR
jgi:oligo-1,6-glucosidase/alpha-glucosidase